MKKVKLFEDYVSESRGDFQIYHRTYSSTIDEIERYAAMKGYHLDSEEYGNAYVDAFFKPKEGATKKDTLSLYKNDKEQKKALHVQIYGRSGTAGYELNMYIN